MLSTFRSNHLFANVLIVTSLLLLVILFLPIARLFIPFSTSVKAEDPKSYTIYIPKIGAQSKIIEQVDAFNQAVYSQALKQGVGEAKGFSTAGKGGLIYLFAHSADPNWDLSKYNYIFFRLGELENGDKIILTKNNKEYVYEVVDKKVVWPDQTDFLKDKKKDLLVLQTCTPIGTSLKRLLVFAKPL